MADLWHYTHGGKQMEPVTAGELKAHATSGFLTPNDLVWKEGMEAWVKASTLKGLFPPGVVAPPAPKAAPSQAVRSKHAVDNLRVVVEADDEEDLDEPRPRKRRPDEEDDDGDRDASRDIRRRSRSKPGLSGLAIGLIIGGVAVVVLIAIGVGAFFIFRGGSGNDNFSVSLGPRDERDRRVSFQVGNSYEIRVTSTQNTDVDLHILNSANQIVALDESIGPNSFLVFTPNVSGNHTVRIRNLDMVRGNQSQVVIKNLGKGARAEAAPPQPVVIQPNIQMPKIQIPPVQVPPIQIPQAAPFAGNNPLAANPVPGPSETQKFALAPRGKFEATIVFPNAKRIEVGVDTDNPGNDVDVFVFRIQGKGRIPVASDTAISHTCRTSFQAQANTMYVIEVRNLGGFATNGSLIYTQP